MHILLKLEWNVVHDMNELYFVIYLRADLVDRNHKGIYGEKSHCYLF